MAWAKLTSGGSSLSKIVTVWIDVDPNVVPVSGAESVIVKVSSASSQESSLITALIVVVRFPDKMVAVPLAIV